MSSQFKQHDNRPIAAIILAAGKGTRMQSDLPKVLHQVAGKPMVQWVIDAVIDAGADHVVLVVGHGADAVRQETSNCEYVVQEPQLGTGHAALVCKDILSDFKGDILVLGGDGPLLRVSTIHEMIDLQHTSKATATLATSIIPDPAGYGRIVRDTQDRFEAIVEHKNATPEQLQIHEVYPSYAIFDAEMLWDCLASLEPNPLTNEYYLTELPRMFIERNLTVEIINTVAPEDILSINTPEQLAQVEAVLLARIAKEVESTT